MKKINHEYIGEIPPNWAVKRFKYLNKDTNTGEQINKEWRQDGNDYLFTCAVEPEQVSYPIFPKEKLTRYHDLLLTRNARPYVFIPPIGSMYTDHVHRFSIIDDVNIHFLYYALLNSSILLYDEGVSIPTYTVSMWNNLPIPVPPIETQHRIADYLDDKTAILDEKIAAAKSQIENLKTYRAALIHDVVCHGVPGTHDNSDYVNSGIQWIGDIPKEWEITKGKYLFTERSTRGNDILVLLSPTQKYGVIPQSELEGAVRVKDDDVLPTFKTVHKGDFIISLRSFQGGFEYSELEGVCSPAYHTFVPIVCIHDGYYRYLFKSAGFIDEMASHCMSLRDGQNIPFEWVKNTSLPVPSLLEQQQISKYLNNKTKLVDEAIQALENTVQDLEDYKKALIYEIVTGKKTV